MLHFACLTDEDISAPNKREFTWPLNDSIFRSCANPVDWKYQVLLKLEKSTRILNVMR